MKKYIHPTVKFVALASEATMAAASTKIFTETVDGSEALGKETEIQTTKGVWDE